MYATLFIKWKKNIYFENMFKILVIPNENTHRPSERREKKNDWKQ